jgi:RNA 2',3'-cyclic 3'-phosphodiesterase
MTTSSDPTKLRVFCGIDVPPAVLTALRTSQREFQEILQASKVSWPNLAEAHLTLLFLGSVDSHTIPEISQALALVCGQSRAMNLALSGRGCFPSERNPKVMWAGVEDPERRLTTLEARVRHALCAHVARPDERAFHPHLTIARIKHLARTERDALATWLRASISAPGPWRVTSVKLYSSQLASEGAKHSVLAEHLLACD